jgi:hypothetical protein
LFDSWRGEPGGGQGRMKDIIKDALIAHYARNEDYHDSKDSLVWLSSSVFIGLSIASWGWLFSNPCFLPKHRLEITIFFILVFGPACLFTWWQNWLKCLSVEQSCRFYNLVSFIGSREPNHSDLMQIVEVDNIPFWHGGLAREALPGAILLWVLIVLSVFQVVLVWMPFVHCFLALLR